MIRNAKDKIIIALLSVAPFLQIMNLFKWDTYDLLTTSHILLAPGIEKIKTSQDKIAFL